jgi:mono/diheme cytochrome c family protein
VKRLLIVLLILLVLVPAAGLLALLLFFPRSGAAPDFEVAGTEARVREGEYLARHVTACFTCHGERDWEHYAAPTVPGTEGGGGRVPEGAGVTVNAPNITPHALGEWTDGEIARAITCGVTKDGNPLAPYMPYLDYHALREEDLQALVAYLRTLPSLATDLAGNTYPLPFRLLMRVLPPRYGPAPAPAEETPAGRGRYLATLAGCRFCHTPFEKGRPVEAKAFAGGHEFALPGGGSVVSSNVSPDTTTGIGAWEEDDFVSLFRGYASETARQLPVSRGNNTIMPWTSFAGMRDEDLAAIYAYLRVVPAQSNEVN